MHSNSTDFSFLDQADIRARYASGERLNRIRFYVGGIKCGKCVRKLEDLSLNMEGLMYLRVEMGKSLAHAEIDPDKTSFADIARKIAALGFEPIPLPREVGEESAQRLEDRQDLARLAVAGACAGNIMTFSFATYLGAPESFAAVFSWLSFALYLPVVTYVAWPFYRGAWNSLRQGQLSIDLPMAVASLAGFVFSTVELLRGRDDIYFDSLAGFLFLILVSRWTQKRLQRRFLRPQELLQSLQLERVRRVHDGGWTWVPADSLKVGDRVLVTASETLPAEGELVTATAHFSMAWLSGESRPKTFLRGATVPAGARLLNGEAQLIARRPLADTAFGQLLAEVQKFPLSRNRIVSQADRWAQWLLTIVFGVALAYVALFFNSQGEEAMRRALALIILACPCAMAFGTPLALAMSLRRTQRRGLVVRNANAFENVRKVDTVFFDKTGTLTETDLDLVREKEPIAAVYQKIVLALENESVHPIAFAFRKAFQANGPVPPVDGWSEVPGLGVSGFVYGKFYEIKRNSKAGTRISCTLFEERHPVQEFEFEARVKPQTREVLNYLRTRGLRVALLSGDKRSAVERLAQDLGFKSDDIYAEVTPDAKARLLEKEPRAMMVGDGVNDSLALMRAHVGVAVSGGMEAALRSSDVYLVNDSLEGVKALFEISEQGFALIRQNLLISVIYNSVGGVAALLGFVNPLVAAVLMPISSGFILLSTWFGSRKA